MKILVSSWNFCVYSTCNIEKIFIKYRGIKKKLEGFLGIMLTLLSSKSEGLIIDKRIFPYYYWREALADMSLPQSAVNSVLLSLSVAIVQTISCVLVGYGLAKYKFKGHNVAFGFVIAMLLKKKSFPKLIRSRSL